MAVDIESRCGACGRSLRIHVDQELRWSTPELGGTPLLFEPSIDWSHFFGSSIIHDY